MNNWAEKEIESKAHNFVYQFVEQLNTDCVTFQVYTEYDWLKSFWKKSTQEYTAICFHIQVTDCQTEKKNSDEVYVSEFW